MALEYWIAQVQTSLRSLHKADYYARAMTAVVFGGKTSDGAAPRVLHATFCFAS
jgi:hypothetical protein